jgi:hypothetical protein
MNDQITVLDPQETEATLAGNRFGKTESMLGKIAEALMGVIDTEASVFATGLNESTINSLRTRMSRRSVRVIVRKARRNDVVGHVLLARSIR